MNYKPNPIIKKYGAPSLNQAIKSAIAAECVGGQGAVDALKLLNEIIQNVGQLDPGGRPNLYAQVREHVRQSLDAMEADVRKRWKLPPREESGASAGETGDDEGVGGS